MMIGLLFLLGGAIMTASVVHDLSNRDVSSSSLEEAPCSNTTDTECFSARCPVTGWRWSEGERRCETLPGYKCCTTCTNQYQCFSPAEDVKCCSGQAIAPSAYKSMCHKGQSYNFRSTSSRSLFSYFGQYVMSTIRHEA